MTDFTLTIEDPLEKERIRKEKRKAYYKAYHEANREKHKAYSKEYYKTNKGFLYNAYALKYRTVNRVSYSLAAARYRAKKKGLPFNITSEDIVIPDVCPVFGAPFVYGDNKRTMSVDRVIPELGYVKGNIQIISNLANAMKQDATKEELIMFAKWVLKEYTDD